MFKCEKCEREFETEDALKQHTQDKHMEKVEEIVKKSKIPKATLFYVLAIVAVVAAFYFYTTTLSPEQILVSGIGAVGSTHEHVDFKVYLNGVPIDLSQSIYQVRSPIVHVEGGDGDIIHKHATGVKVGFFFQTLGMKFNSTCFILDTGEQFCNEGDKTLKFYLNGQRSDLFDNYELTDLDKILISYGNESESQIQSQLATITDKARTIPRT